MLGKTPEAAVEAFLEPLGRATTCITTQPLVGSGYLPSSHAHIVSFLPRDTPVALNAVSGRRGIGLRLGLLYLAEEETDNGGVWRVRLTGYRYDILDRDRREILAFHWHPMSLGPAFPHVHLTGRLLAIDLGPGFAPVALGDMHIPTGWVTLAAVVRLLILEFGIKPLRSDWELILRESDGAERALGAF